MQHSLIASLLGAKQRGEWVWLEAKTLRDLGITRAEAELIAARVFDAKLGDSDTNILLIDGAAAPDQGFAVLNGLFAGLDALITGLPGRSLVHEGTGFAISKILAVPGLAEMSELAGQYVGDLLTEALTGLSEAMIDSVVAPIAEDIGDRMVGKTQDELKDILSGFAEQGFQNIITYLEDRPLHLSREAQAALHAEFDKLRKAAPTSASACFQMVVRMVLACASGEGGQKLILLRNPHLLDPASFTLLQQLLLSACEASQERKAWPISVMICDCGENAEQDRGNARLWLNRMRLFAIRNSLFATPFARHPVAAITEGLFVGRMAELKALAETGAKVSWHVGRVVASVISAESGIGKTSLVREHLKTLQSAPDTAPPFILTLACPPTVGSGQGGVQSLLNSLEDNLHALMADRSLLTRLGAFTKGQFTTKELTKRLIGFDFEEVRRSLVDLSRQASLRDELSQRLRKGTAEEEAGEPLDRLLTETVKLFRQKNGIKAKDTLPLYLRIDDLHWITEGSAGVLLKHFITGHPLRLLVTLRPAEWKVTLRQAMAEPDRHSALLLLALVLGLATLDELPATLRPEATSLLRALTISAQHIALSGFSPALLAQAISTSMGAEEANFALAEATAQAIVDFLDDGDSANSLMAIETFNLLADDGFAQRHSDWPLVEWENNRPRWSPRCHALPLESDIRARLGRLQAVYRGTYRGEGGLSLPSYAVFEEKLSLLTAYFGESGPAVRFFLYLSALAGAPFMRHLIEGVLEEFSTAQQLELSPLALQRLRASLQWRNNLRLEQECLSLDTTFALLRRVHEVSTGHEFRHNLLSTFFEAGLDVAMEALCEGLSAPEVEAFQLWFYTVCLKHFDVEPHFEALRSTNSRTEALAMAEAGVRVGQRLLRSLPSPKTAITAQNTLSVAVQLHFNIGEPLVAISHLVEMLAIYDGHLPFDEEFSAINARLRIGLGMKFKDCQRKELAIRTLRPVIEACPDIPDTLSYRVLAAQMLAELVKDPAERLAYVQFAEKLHTGPRGELSPEWAAIDPGGGQRQSIALQSRRALACRDARDLDGYLRQTEETLRQVRPLALTDPEEWLRSYTVHLNNHSEALRLNDFWEEAECTLDYALLILRSKFAEDPTGWAIDLVMACRNQGNTYLELRKTEAARETLFKAIQTVEHLLDEGQPLNAELAEQVGLIWSTLSEIGADTANETLQLMAKSEELAILSRLHGADPQRYALFYAERLTDFAVILNAISAEDRPVPADLDEGIDPSDFPQQAKRMLNRALQLIAATAHSEESFARAHHNTLCHLLPLVSQQDGVDAMLKVLTEMAELAFARRAYNEDYWGPAVKNAVYIITQLLATAGRSQEAAAWRNRLNQPG